MIYVMCSISFLSFLGAPWLFSHNRWYGLPTSLLLITILHFFALLKADISDIKVRYSRFTKFFDQVDQVLLCTQVRSVNLKVMNRNTNDKKSALGSYKGETDDFYPGTIDIIS